MLWIMMYNDHVIGIADVVSFMEDFFNKMI